MSMQLPSYVQSTLNQLNAAGFEAFVVGGSVRDLLMDREPKDYDVTTNATPEQIQATFKDTLYNNNFGTVVVRIAEQKFGQNMDCVRSTAETAEDEQSAEAMEGAPGSEIVRHEIEVTPYRAEAEYTDKRHPDSVTFGVSLEEDLKRRDFTINAMAFDGAHIIDLFKGQEDIANKVIRTVGEPVERFNEDALRMIRAIRFAAQLGFQLDNPTTTAITEHAPDITNISWERIRDELMKIITSDNSYRGIWLMHTTGLLKHIIPELETGVGVTQNKHHIYTVFMHNLLSMQHCTSDDPLVRLAALLHDVGKPQAKEGEGPDSSFHNHEHIGGEIAAKICKRLKFSSKDTQRVAHLVKQHMFYYSQGEVSDAGIRRLLKRIGRENLDDLMAIRIGDRMGSGCQKEKPQKLVELERRIRAVEKDPMDTTMLKVDGNDIMELTGLAPGREVGQILNALLEDVLEDPSLNTRDFLLQRAKELQQHL